MANQRKVDTMDLNSQHFVLIRELREALRIQDWDALETLVETAGLEMVLNADLLSAARGLNAREVVVLLASLGSENSEQPLPYRRLLAAYQLMQKKIDLTTALDQCDSTPQQTPYFEALLRQVQSSDKANIEIPTSHLGAEELWFGIQLMCDAHCPSRMFGLLKAWQTIESDDKPWLMCSRLIIERAELAKGHFERKVLGDALEEAIRKLPQSQKALKPIMQATLLDKLWLPNADNEKALQLAQDLVTQSSTIDHRMMHLRALIRNQAFDQAVSLGESVLLEIIDQAEQGAWTEPTDPSGSSKYQVRDFDTTAAALTLTTVNRALKAKGLQPFLISGSLLGCMRDGQIMPHDKDLDMGLIGWESQFELAQAILELGCFDINLKRLKGEDLFLISAVDQRTNIAVDFFMFHDKGDHFLHGIDYQYGFTQNFRFSKFNLTETEFLEDSFYIPDQWERMLEENYGQWKTPEPAYVVTVESPGLTEQGSIKHQLIAQLELLKTILNGLKPQRAQRIVHAASLTHPALLSIQLSQRVVDWVDWKLNKTN
jgi:hypothetical protein